MNVAASSPLRRSLLIIFILPSVVLGIMHGPEGQIQAIYAKHAGIALTALAAATLLTKMFDAVTYPLIGYLCDRTYAATGTRKSWVIAGAAVSMLGIWNLLRPPQGVDIFYFGIWMATTYIGWKLMEIPLQAWSYGLSSDYAQRARVQAWRVLALGAGQLLFFAIPQLAVVAGYTDSTELDFRSLGFSAIVCVVALPLATLASVLLVKDRGAAPVAAKVRPGLAEAFNSIRRNPNLLRLISAVVPISLLGGMLNGVAYLYIDSYLHLGAKFPAIMAVALLSGIAAIPFWGAMAARFERHRTLAASSIVCGTACALFSLVSPGPLAAALSFVLYSLMIFNLTGVSVIIYTMCADIVEYQRLTTGEDHAGLYGAIFSFVQKSVLGLAAAAGLALTGWFGFNPSAMTQTTSGLIGIKLAGALLPALGFFIAAAIIWNYSLTRARIAEKQLNPA